MPNPNEVMDVQRQMYRSSNNPRAHMLFQTYRAMYREKGEEALADIAESVDKLIAQQNAALLRELSEKAVEVNMVQYHYEDGSKVIAGWTNSAIPASILEAKLKELEEQL
jgi:hypothetical protein